MKRSVSLFLFVLTGTFVVFGQNSLNVDLIADSLREDADAVVRFHHTTYERKSLDAYSVTKHYAVTILNSNGKRHARLAVHYDRNSEITNLQGVLYNAQGKMTDKIKKKDVRDYASNASYTLFSDNRVKTFNPAMNVYPYTIEYKYTVENKGVVGFETWIPSMYGVSIEHAELVFKTPEAHKLRYKVLNYDFKFDSLVTGQGYEYTWSMAHMMAREYEPAHPYYLDYIPAVMLAPVDISYEGSRGDYRTWNSYGKWVYSLIEERDVLAEETVQKMKALTDTIPDPYDKVKAVYQYMQNRTRYVNILLGIGGFQPLLASDVDVKGYGDCKALSNYTRALLKTVGITSYYTEIGSGSMRELKFPGFVSANQTNHIILCVPMKQDTVWLECTSQTIPFGYIGTGNSNRYALLVSEEGGELVRTPKYSGSENTRITSARIDIGAGGDARFEGVTDFRNAEYEDVRGWLQGSQKEQKDFLLEQLPFEGCAVERFSMEDMTVDIPEARISVAGEVLRFATKAGSRLFISPEYIFSQTGFYAITADREENIYKRIGYNHRDTVTLVLPENFQIESLPVDTELQSVYGTYSLGFESTPYGLRIIRNLEVFAGEYSSKHFKAINSFTRAITRSDEKRIIINR